MHALDELAALVFDPKDKLQSVQNNIYVTHPTVIPLAKRHFVFAQKFITEAGEMAALPEDPTSIPNTHRAALSCLYRLFQGISHSSALHEH